MFYSVAQCQGGHMQIKKIIQFSVIVGGAAALPATAAETVGNWYIGGGVGQSRADTPGTGPIVRGTPVTSVAVSSDDTGTAGKAFLGYQFNKYLAAEGGYFRLGDFSFTGTTTPAGTLNGSF